MPDFTSTLPDTHFRVPQRSLKTVLETYRQELFTGLLRLRYPSGVDLVSSFLDGVQQKLYRCLNESMEAIPRQSWSHFMDRPDASIASLSLSLEGMRLMRVAHEAPVLRAERIKCTPVELTEQVGVWAADKYPIIFHLQNDIYNRIYLMAGHSTPVIEELTVKGNEARFSICNVAFPNSLSPFDQATRYVCDGEHEVWQEYELRFAYNPFVRMLVNRFSELAGRSLTERLCEMLSQQLRDGGWKINITMNGVVNHHYFDSFNDAKNAYLDVMRRFHYESSLAIGSRLAERIALETLHKLGPHRYELLRRHIYNKDALEIPTGGAWRSES